MRIPRVLLPLLLASGCAAAGFAVAEDLDVGRLLDEGKAEAAAKHYGKSLHALTMAVTEVTRLRLEALKVLFPPAKEGWEATEIEAQSNFGLLGGAGFATLKRTYTKGDTSYDAELVVDSPMVGQMQMLLNAGAMQPGTQLITVQGRKAALHLEKEQKSGELQILLNVGNAMLTIRGRQVAKADMEAYANGFSLEVLEKAIVE